MNAAIRRAVRVAENVERAAVAIRKLQVRRHLRLFAALRASGMREVTCACGTMMLTRGSSNQCPPCRGLAPHISVGPIRGRLVEAMRLDSFERVEFPAFDSLLETAEMRACPFCGDPVAISVPGQTLAHSMPHCERFAAALESCSSFAEAHNFLDVRAVHA